MRPRPLIALISTAVLAALPLAGAAEPAVKVPPSFSFPPPPAEAWSKLPAHPRLFARAERWAELKKQLSTDPVSQKLFALIRERAENLLALPSLDLRAKGIHLHGPMRQMQARISGLAMCYRLTGEERYLARAKQEILELAATPEWRPGHFLSTAEATLAMALGYDWLYDELTPAERDLCAQAIVEKALLPSLEAEKKQESWLTSGGNWGPVCHGGMAIGALAIAEREPELAARIVRRSLDGVRYAAANYAPAGAHSEGPGYWAYGTNFYFLFADALKTTFGTTCDLEKAPAMLQTGDYNLQMTTPTGKMYSYGDSVPHFGFEPVMFWFARELRQYYLASTTLERLDEMKDILVSDGAQPDASRLQTIALLWWDPALRPAADKVIGPLNWWSQGGPQPQAVMRSAWGDPRAAYVGLKAGKADESHGHMDAGSFIYEVNGVRWAVDLGRNDYNAPRRHGLGSDLFRPGQESKRWAIFRNGAESHNILRFNSGVQWVDGMTEIRPATRAEAQPGYTMDLTPAYAGQVSAVRRGISLRPGRALVVRDEWQAGERGVLVAWQWLTFAKVEITPDGATLTQNEETLHLQARSSGDAHFAVESLATPANAWDGANPGLNRITIRLSSAAHEKSHLVVVAGAPDDVKSTANDPLLARSLAEW